jgi:hypothetical protein
MTVSAPEVVVGGLLLYALPGYTVTKALFPEWRIRGEVALLRAIEIGTLSLVLSVTFTVLAGFALGALPGSLFQAGWGDPLLELLLAAIAALGAAAGLLRGAYRRHPPAAPALVPDPGTDAWTLLRQLEDLHRRERRLQHALRRSSLPADERLRLQTELGEVIRRAESLTQSREAEYAQ